MAARKKIDMPVRNYRTRQESQRSLDEIHRMLRSSGARQVLWDYDDDDLCSSVAFKIKSAKAGMLAFRMPLHLSALKRRLDQQYEEKTIGVRVQDMSRVEEIGLKCLQEMLHVQLSLLDTGLFALEEVMFGHMLDDSGERLFDTTMTHLQLPPPEGDTDGE